MFRCHSRNLFSISFLIIENSDSVNFSHMAYRGKPDELFPGMDRVVDQFDDIRRGGFTPEIIINNQTSLGPLPGQDAMQTMMRVRNLLVERGILKTASIRVNPMHIR